MGRTTRAQSYSTKYLMQLHSQVLNPRLPLVKLDQPSTSWSMHLVLIFSIFNETKKLIFFYIFLHAKYKCTQNVNKSFKWLKSKYDLVYQIILFWFLTSKLTMCKIRFQNNPIDKLLMMGRYIYIGKKCNQRGIKVTTLI